MARISATALAVLCTAALLPAALACGAWSKSSAANPVPNGAYEAKWASTPEPWKPSFFCYCTQANRTGALINSNYVDAPGWLAFQACFYQRADGNSDFCRAGDYLVLTAQFPSYNGPQTTNSTSIHPVPSQSLAAPTPDGAPAAYACVQNMAEVLGTKGAVPGGLMIGDGGSYVCQSVIPAWSDPRSVIYTTAKAGEYAVPTGSLCM